MHLFIKTVSYELISKLVTRNGLLPLQAPGVGEIGFVVR